ncbi:17833_t:CDS:1, partial [Gigaspora rosea]
MSLIHIETLSSLHVTFGSKLSIIYYSASAKFVVKEKPIDIPVYRLTSEIGQFAKYYRESYRV